MRKKLIILLSLVMVFTLCFSACGGGSENAPAGTPEDDKVYTLTLTTHDTPESAAVAYQTQWAEMVKEKSGGRLIVEIYPSAALAKPTETVDFVRDGTVDLGWGLPHFYPGIFPLIDVISLPMIGLNSSELTTRVLWDLYNEFPELQAEWSDFKVIGFRANCDVPITSGKVKVEKLSDMKGWNIRGVSGPPNDFITAIGASPVNVPVADVYSALQNSTLDATISDWHAVLSFRMYEAAKFFADEQITVNSFYFIMNWDSYNNLPADLQAVIDECSGQNMVDLDITIFDRVEEEAKALIQENGGEIYTFSPETRDELQAAADQVVASWIETQTAAGYPAQKLYDRMLELIDEWS